MSKNSIIFIILLLSVNIASSAPLKLSKGDAFQRARAEVVKAGWQPDPLMVRLTPDVAGVEHELINKGYLEVDYCSIDTSNCILQYRRGKQCLRLQTQGEHIRWMKVVSWSSKCPEKVSAP